MRLGGLRRIAIRFMLGKGRVFRGEGEDLDVNSQGGSGEEVE